MSLLEVRDVSHTYGSGTAVLKDVNLSADSGSVVALVGESGCGKTTLGKMIVGLNTPTRGSVHFDGADTANLSRGSKKSWRRRVQLIHQDPYGSLNPGLTIGSALTPGMIKYKLATRRNAQDKAIELLRSVGLDATPDFLQRYPHQLSGGQRQRVAIARAMACQPDLVVADEVTSMLDVSMRVAILDLLLSFKQSRGTGFVFISHDFGVVRYVAQGGRIVVMFFGHVVEEGPTEDVISAPKHPYTHMLLEAIPIPDPGLARGRAKANEGVTQPIADPSKTGCPFANRCPLVQTRCRTERPPLIERSDGHLSACHFADDVPPLAHLDLTELEMTGTEEPHRDQAGVEQ